MARVLIASSAEKGHVNPLIGVAQQLKEMHHEVGWLCLPKASDQIKSLKVDQVKAELPAHEHVTGGEALSALVRNPAALRKWIGNLLIDAVPGQVDALRHAISHYNPTIIATDPMLYGVIIAAELEHKPWVGVSNSLNPLAPAAFDCELTRTLADLNASRFKLFALHGLSPSFRVSDCLSPLLNVVFAAPEFTRDIGEPAANTQQVGASIPMAARGDEPKFDWKKVNYEAPLIYVSFGSQISWQPEIFGKLAQAASGLPVQVVISAGDLADTDWAESLPKNCLAVKYAPQMKLLERASGFVTHGGANSVMEALYCGVPMLVSPQCNDQFINAEFVRKARNGITFDLREATVENVSEKLQQLIDQDAPFLKPAARLKEAYRARDGAKRAAELVAQLGIQCA